MPCACNNEPSTPTLTGLVPILGASGKMFNYGILTPEPHLQTAAPLRTERLVACVWRLSSKLSSMLSMKYTREQASRSMSVRLRSLTKLPLHTAIPHSSFKHESLLIFRDEIGDEIPVTFIEPAESLVAFRDQHLISNIKRVVFWAALSPAQ